MGTRPLGKQQLNKRIGPGSTLPRPRTDIIPEEVRDPLTPLHRLQRFQKIRDRNLKRELQNKGTQVRRQKVIKKNMETDKASSKTVTSEGEVGTGKSAVSEGPLKTNSKTVVVTHKALESEQLNGQKVENGTVSEEEEIGKRTRSSAKNISESSDSVAQSENIKEPSPEEEAAHGMRTRSTTARPKPSKAEASEHSEDTEDNALRHSPRKALPAAAKSPQKNLKDTPSKDKTPSKEVEDGEEEEAEIDVEEEEEEDKEEEVNEDDKKEASTKDNVRDKTPEYKVLRRSVRIEALGAVDNPNPHLTSTSAPNSNSVLSYMSTRETLSSYRRSPRESYLGRVSGRRPVRGYLTPFRSKRKAEEEYGAVGDAEQSSGEKVKRPARESHFDTVGSPSWVRTPGWRYVPSLNKFWSPRPGNIQNPEESSPVLSSTPYKSSTSLSPIFSESMVVNYDEKTTREFPEVDMTEVLPSPATGSSKWYCNIM